MQVCIATPTTAVTYDDPLSTRGRVTNTRTPLPFGARTGSDFLAASVELPRYVLCHVRAGSAVFKLDGVALPVVAPAIVLLDDRLRPEISCARGLHMATLYFHPALINNAFAMDLIHSSEGRASFRGSTRQDLFLLERFFAEQPAERVSQLPSHVHERVKQSIDMAAAEASVQPDRYWPCRVRSFLIEALFQLRMLAPVPITDLALQHEATSTPPAADTRGSRVARAMSFLQERYQSDFTLTEVARACYTNRTTLNAEFRAATGMTVRAYTISLRMKMAAGMLRDTGLPVAEIMNRVGYENPSHFTRAFRQTLGTSPRDYRNTQCWINKH
jgi:AraC-like DNA-binding protein